MAGFNWNQFYTIFKAKLEKDITCTVGRYVTPRETDFPYVDLEISEITGQAYDLEGGEGAVNPMLSISVYCNGASGDSTCYTISEEAKKVMLSYGFQCRGGPMKVDNADPNVVRWTGRYQRIFADGDELTQLN